MRKIIIAFVCGFLLASMPVIAKKITPAVDQVKVKVKIEKEKHKEKTFKQLSTSEKDYMLYVLCQDAGMFDGEYDEK